jgi:hypothetical protein
MILKNLDATFKSIFKVPDLRIGLLIYNEEETSL